MKKTFAVIASERSERSNLRDCFVAAARLLAMTFCISAPAWSQPAMIQKSPADYAASYDAQLPQPRKTLDEKRLEKGVRQGAFARQLVRSLVIEDQLPLSASEDDCIMLLNTYGISPLKGWDRFARVSEDDYAVIMGKAIGKEYIVHQKSQEVCDEIVDVLNVEWKQYYLKYGHYPILEKLITDKSIFPGAEPRCPYGEPYKIVGFQPHIAYHKHIIKTPLRNWLYKERDLLKEWFKPGPGDEKKTW